MSDALRKALHRAFSLGQTYWQQADSESYKQNAKSAETLQKFDEFVEATAAALSAQPVQELVKAPSEPWQEMVRIPTSSDEAEMMAKLGIAWLEQHAPERLKKPGQEMDAKDAARLEDAEEALLKIKQWAAAYPATVFIEPDLERANEVLAAAGISMTGMHGTWGRHIAAGMGKIATEALAAIAAQGTGDKT